MSAERIVVVGGGLAGSEAAWQLARAGVDVTLVEMRPGEQTSAHRTGGLAELVCSNSLRGDAATQAVGLLKREMEELGSLVVTAARATAVPAGGALAVDRGAFSSWITTALERHPRVEVARRRVDQLPDGPAVVATGPLTAAALQEALEGLLGAGSLSFFDAVAPIVSADSLDRGRLFRASRYGKGGDDYLNAPMSREEYERFVAELVAAERVPFRAFEAEEARFFEGCLPIEVMAERGVDTLRFGPMKPVGLVDPQTGRRPWAVVQLRQDDVAAEHWNLVGFQTKLKVAEQRRVFQLIPGLEAARFVRFGMIHRNTFVNAPLHLDPLLRLRARPEIRLAGQLTGVEGYVESAATGLLAGRLAAAEVRGGRPGPPPGWTALGGLVRHLTTAPGREFQPANISWGLIQCPEELSAIRDRARRRQAQAERALASVREWAAALRG